MRKVSRSDRALLESAWREVHRMPKTYAGRYSSTRSGVFAARYEGYCGRCGFPIKIGQDIRFHRDFDGAVHDGCRQPKVTIRTTRAANSPSPNSTRTVTATRQPHLCPECNLGHAGECF